MSLSSNTILITGGAGFIGSALTRRLCSSNQIIILDNLSRNTISDTGLISHPQVKLIKGDVRDFEIVKKATENCNIIIHLASIAGVDTVLKNPVLTMEVSLLGILNLLKATHKKKLKRFVDFSTSEVFGRYAYQVHEGDVTSLGAVGEARWTYAVSKLCTEHLVYNYYKTYQFPSVSVRPFNIYGPGQKGEGAIHNFVIRALQNKPLIVHNEGAQIRSWCYIDDIVNGIILTLEKQEAIGHTFNIGNPRSTITIYNLARLIIRLSNSSSKIKFIKRDSPDVELRIPNIKKAQKILNFKPKIDLEEGLIKTIKWYKERLNKKQ
jgi:nucleoside-diphosphate-sugar epimerase